MRRGSLLVATLVLAAAATLGAPGSSAAERPSMVALRSGHIGHYAWEAYVLVAPEPEAEQPGGLVCVGISMLQPTSANNAEGTGVAGCGAPPSSRPLIEYFRGGRDGRSRSVLVVLLTSDVKRVYVEVAGQPGRTYRTGHLSLEALAAASPVPLAFFAHGYAAPLRVRRIVGYGADGAVLSRLGGTAS
jgi:hypothetical protein